VLEQWPSVRAVLVRAAGRSLIPVLIKAVNGCSDAAEDTCFPR
jgi:hypothetical protein